jgi:hypothetical protein
MLVDDITIEVRDRDFERVGQIHPKLWTDVKVIPRHLGVGEWSLSLPAEDPMAVALAVPGAGLVIAGPGGMILSGPVAPFSRTQSPADLSGRTAFNGVSDDIVLWDALAYPDPTHLENAQTLAYDEATGPAETLLHYVMDANLGPGSGTDQAGGLAQKITSHGPNLGRGGTRSLRARFDILGELMAELATLAGLGFRVVQVDSELEFQTFQPADLSRKVRLDVANGTLAKIEYTVAPPTVTRVIVGGQGEGADRTIIGRTSAAALAAETAWGRKIVRFKDQRNTDDIAELQQAADKDLATGGMTAVETKVIPIDALNIAYGVDWREGDRVAVVVADTETTVTVTSAVISITKDGVIVGATIGDR